MVQISFGRQTIQLGLGENTRAAQRAASAAAQSALDATNNGAAQVALATAQATIATDLASGIGLSFTQQSLGRSPRIAPSALWNGTAGSGWAVGTEPTASVARARTDPARPPCSPFYPYNRWAFNTRTRLLFNVEERSEMLPVTMRVHLEGNTVDVPADTLQHYVGDDGIERTAWLRAFDLDWANFSTNGKCRFYIEAIPSDPTMASRIIGPFEMKRKTGSLWDAVLTFGPGGTYADYAAARAAAVAAPYNTSSYEHIQLKPASSHDYDIVGRSVPTIYNRWGKTLVDGAPGVIWRVHSSEWRTTPQAFEPNTDGLVFGPSCHFDMRRMLGVVVPRVSQGAVQAMHFAGARLYDPNGRDAMFGLGAVKAGSSGSTALTNPDAKDRRSSVSFVYPGNNASNPGVHMTECRIEWPSRSPLTGVQLARNNVQLGGNEDVFSPGGWSSNTWALCFGNVVHEVTPEYVRAQVDAISITYAAGGPATTATVQFFGTNNSSGNRIYLRENGSISYTVVVSTTLGTGNYSVADVAAWINANCPNWTATVIDDTRRASYFNTKAETNAKGVAVVNSTWIDNHADGWQISGMSGQNYVAKNNQLINCGALQVFFLSMQNTALDWCDSVWANNPVQFNGTDPELVNVQSQFEGRFSNVRVENNYCLQGFFVRTQFGTTSFDDKCTIEANVMTGMTIDGTTSLGTCSVKYNQALAASGSFPSGTNVANNVTSTSLLSDPVPTRIKYDINNERRTGLSRRGVFR